MNIQNYSIMSSAITAEDIERAMGKVREAKKPFGNPCSEVPLASGGILEPGNIYISGQGSLHEWKTAESIAGGIINANKITTGRIMRTKDYKTDYDQDTVTVEVPGIPKSEIEVFIQNKVLFIKVREEPVITHRLDDSYATGGDLTVSSVKLDLGVLTIILDKSEKRKLLEID